MLERLVALALRNRVAVSVAFLLALALGLRALLTLEVDAFPDTTPVQVQLNTVAPALSPEEIERQITFPVEASISGLPGLQGVRSISKFGFSQVVATFTDDMPMLDARQLIVERLSTVRLPDGIEPPALGPMSTGLGEVFHYLLRSRDPAMSLEEVRALHDWVVKPELRRIPGVAEINSWGGREKQFQVVIEPSALLAWDLTIQDVVLALEKNNRNVGGGRLDVSGESPLLYGVGRLHSAEEIGDVVVKSHAGVPLRIRDVAQVEIGHEIRLGAVTADGQGEAVLGLAFMLPGENSHEVTTRLKRRLEDLKPSLPENVEVDVVYDRTALVDLVIRTVEHNLISGAVLVIAVLFLLLGSLRTGSIIALSIPLSMILAAWGMKELSIAASLLSLGAMDFGIIVDGAVVMAENALRRLGEKVEAAGRALDPAERMDVVLRASTEVARPVFFGVAIIALVLVPVLALQGVEGKLFRPMALTFGLAMVAALLLALFLTPALSWWLLPARPSTREAPIARIFLRIYDVALGPVLRSPRRWIVGGGGLVLGAFLYAFTLGSEFVPRLNEGTVVLNVVRLAGLSLDESVAYNTRMEELLRTSFPDEIDHVWSRCGTAEVATDPMGTELTDVFISLTPRGSWTKVRTPQELVAAIQAVVSDLPGQTINMTQPIEMRMNEMLAGIRSDLGIKIYGEDFAELTRLSDSVQELVSGIKGAANVSGEQITGQPVLRVTVNRQTAARNGVAADHVLEVVEAVAGLPVGEIQEGERRIPVVVRLPERMRRDPQALATLVLPTDSGTLLPLDAVADLEATEGPSTITREWARRRTLAQCNVQGRDLGSFVDEVRQRVKKAVVLPSGYTLDFGGQFEQLAAAKVRFAVLVPLTLLLVFLLLWASLRRWADTIIVFTGIPLAAVGGILALGLRGLPLSVSAFVGFIALSGIAVLNGQVLVSTVRRELSRGLAMADAVRSAGRRRLRPVLATAIVDAVGFLPMALSTGVGAEVQRPLATVVIGGVLTSTLLTLFLLPAIYVALAARLGAPGEEGMVGPPGVEPGTSGL